MRLYGSNQGHTAWGMGLRFGLMARLPKNALRTPSLPPASALFYTLAGTENVQLGHSEAGATGSASL